MKPSLQFLGLSRIIGKERREVHNRMAERGPCHRGLVIKEFPEEVSRQYEGKQITLSVIAVAHQPKKVCEAAEL